MVHPDDTTLPFLAAEEDPMATPPLAEGNEPALSQSTTETPVATPSPYSHERFRWFAVFAQSGMEKKAKEVLEQRIKKLNLDSYFGQILIPTMTVEKIDINGKKKKTEQRMMPGYLFIQMDPNNKATFNCVKETPKISTFIGSEPNQEPRPMPDDEIRRLFDRTEAEAQVAKKKVVVAFSKGDRVRVIDGPFSNFIGDVDEVAQDRTKLRLLISVFGRPTPLDIDMSKVEKAKEGE